MSKLFMVRTLRGLSPVDDAGHDLLSRIKLNKVVEVELTQKRNIKFHRKYWALLQIVFENMDGQFASIEDLHGAVKIAAGLRTRIELKDGTVGFLPGSIAFHKMDAEQFTKFFDRVCDLISLHFLPGVSSKSLKAQVEEMIGVAHV